MPWHGLASRVPQFTVFGAVGIEHLPTPKDPTTHQNASRGTPPPHPLRPSQTDSPLYTRIILDASLANLGI